MGKAAMCKQMLQILNTGRVYKISELAEMLETNPRNIVEYKKELEECGYYIDTIPGRYGGYKLDTTHTIPTLKMLPGEKAALVDSYNFILAKKDFINKSGYTKTISKIFSTLMIENNSDVFSVDKVNSAIEQSAIEKYYTIIDKAIKEKNALIIKYRWLKEPTSVCEVHPYQLFLYDNEWRFFGWLIKDGIGDIFYFKLTRIESIEQKGTKFRVWNRFKIEDYIKKNVCTMNGEMFSMTLIAHGVRAKIMKEKHFGYNQKCEDLLDGSTKVTMEMQKNPSTYNTILSFGDLVEVVEPEWLKEKIKKIAKTIYEKY